MVSSTLDTAALLCQRACSARIWLGAILGARFSPCYSWLQPLTGGPWWVGAAFGTVASSCASENSAGALPRLQMSAMEEKGWGCGGWCHFVYRTE